MYEMHISYSIMMFGFCTVNSTLFRSLLGRGDMIARIHLPNRRGKLERQAGEASWRGGEAERSIVSGMHCAVYGRGQIDMLSGKSRGMNKWFH